MTIVEFFDPLDIQHVRAYDYLCNNAIWPEEFHKMLKDEGIEFPSAWQGSLAFKMADAWIEHVLAVADRWKDEDHE